MEEIYRKQVELLIRCLPEVEKQECFALKGGTAINLFVRDMPRLSIDIDLVYLPIESREDTLKNIETGLDEIAKSIETSITKSIGRTSGKEKHVNKLLVSHEGVQIKIEPNIVQRGTVYDTETRSLCARAETDFELSATVNTLASAELYGSKICAALDRQHPRDLFDVMLLLKNEGITEGIRKAFVIYLACHTRPMHELLNPNLLDIKGTFKAQFEGMTTESIAFQELFDTRDTLIKSINDKLTDEERNFLLSVKQGEPNWELLKIEGLENLPAIQWKLRNIEKMQSDKRNEYTDNLKRALQL